MMNVDENEGAFSAKLSASMITDDKISTLEECEDAQEKCEKTLGSSLEQEKLDLANLTNPCPRLMQEREERRWSKRIMKKQKELVQKDGDLGKTACDNFSDNSFSILGNDEVMERASLMGVSLDSNVTSINMLIEMEKSRQNLNDKIIELNSTQKDNNVEGFDGGDSASSVDISDTDDISIKDTFEADGLVMRVSKRERKAPKRMSLSGNKTATEKRNRGAPCPRNRRGDDKQGDPVVSKQPPSK
jgi:hypothetical protein